ncbi:MAG: TVP38/TMEM64 family protein [Stellaceae bacterium]
MRPGWRRLFAGLATAVILGGLIAAWFLFPFAHWLHEFRHWLLAFGPAGAGFFALIFILATVILAPDWPFSVLAGLVYGMWGVPVVIVAATIAASLAFLAARYLARERVHRLVARRPAFAAVDRAVAEEGWKIVLLLRLSPLVPFNLQNYVFGVTGVPFRHYVPATLAGIAPATAVYVYLGMMGKKAAEGGGGGGALEWVLLAVGLLATLAVAVLIARKAKAALAEAAARADLEAAENGDIGGGRSFATAAEQAWSCEPDDPRSATETARIGDPP